MTYTQALHLDQQQLKIQDAIASYDIHADELTEGDIIRHFTGDIWMVINEPTYTTNGITFDVMWLEVPTPDNVQTVCFAPQWRFELLSHQTQTSTLQLAA